MNIKRVWLECEDTDGKCYMLPATPEDLKALRVAEKDKRILSVLSVKGSVARASVGWSRVAGSSRVRGGKRAR